jgi:enoyl-CoA hydratase/carnithine racemase
MSAVSVDRRPDGITLVTLDRPDRLNTMSHQLTTELSAVLDAVATDRSCRVVVLTGAGRAFCAGLDLDGYGDDDLVEEQGTVLRTLSRQRELAGLVQQLHDLPQPVVAAINGPAAGGGLALVCGSDIRIADETAVFAVSFIRAGFSACDLGTSWLLPRIVGAGRAHELMLTGRRFDADEALRIGLVVDVVPGGDVVAAALAKAEQILQNAPASVQLTKQGMWIALETASLAASVEFENRQQVITALTEDGPEAIRAFVEKRPPHFAHR